MKKIVMTKHHFIVTMIYTHIKENNKDETENMLKEISLF